MAWTKTKIIATLGPATRECRRLEGLMALGVDIFRLNFSHDSHAGHAAGIREIRAAERRLGAAAGILQDLPGPKLRVGPLPDGGVALEAGEDCWVVPPGAGPGGKCIPLRDASLVAALRPGDDVYIADGTIRLKVLSARSGMARCRARTSGLVRRGNGVNLPGTPLALRAFTRADAVHMRFGLRMGVDFVAVSFVAGASDILRARDLARRHGKSPFIIAKIERRQAIRNLREIVDAADGLMVARGDLGVEMSFADIPGLQADIIHAARKKGKPVIVATQVLDSMERNPRPTRAEATDVAHAVWGGADAIMLSGETSIGRYPLKAVEALGSVIQAAERRCPGPDLNPAPPRGGKERVFAEEAVRLAEAAGARLLVTSARSGRTALLLSRVRPRLPVAALSSRRDERRFSLLWGVKTVVLDQGAAAGRDARSIGAALVSRGLVRRGQRIVFFHGGTGPAADPESIQIVRV